MSASVRAVISEVSTENIRSYLDNLEGPRHAWHDYDLLVQKAKYIEETLRSFGLSVRMQEVPFHGRAFHNIVASVDGSNPESEEDCILLGAHYDAAWGSPGADDNASGVAVLLEAARIMGKHRSKAPIQFAAFTLEEPQPQTIHFLIGSDHFAKQARDSGTEFRSVIILESVGYTDDAEGSQSVPLTVRASVPERGNFLGIIANKKSESIMDLFTSAAGEYVPELPVVPYRVPLSGRFIPETRFSDHASFWNQNYPAVMLTDTAMFRNPHYHTSHDRSGTLDFSFMTNVAKAVIGLLSSGRL
ncbi:MAG TPA: M28 family peptidase [Thermodesulfovibrionales bacterium]|nr:M28 family peptidase [Thermodesulfovibrionales bacterium]